MVTAGKMIWDDIVNANWIRASSSAVRPNMYPLFQYPGGFLVPAQALAMPAHLQSTRSYKFLRQCAHRDISLSAIALNGATMQYFGPVGRMRSRQCPCLRG